MEKYLYLQLKRNLKILPLVLIVVLALLLCISIILVGMTNVNKNDEKNTKLVIALSGDTDNPMTQMGISAIQTFDDTRFAMEFVELPENEARSALKRGKISAIVIFPEDFIDRALKGDVEPITFVTTPGSQNAATLLKDELTKIIADIIIASEKGTYAIYDAIVANDAVEPDWEYWDAITIEYIDMIISRSDTYDYRELGVSQGLDLGQYYICSMIVFLLMLFGICFVTIYVKSDQSLSRLLLSRGYSCSGQLLCEYFAHFATFLALILCLLLVGSVILPITGANISQILPSDVILSLCLRTLLVLVMLTAFNVMIFEISTDLISGVLLHFFSCVGLCYVSGCFYPVYTLPQVLQKASRFLPTGIAREYLEGAYIDETSIWQLVGILAYSGLFLTVALITRRVKTLHKRG